MVFSESAKITSLIRSLLLLLLLTAVGCLPAASGSPPDQQSVPMPTIFPTPTQPFDDPDNAYRIADEFLRRWAQADFEGMYHLISSASQQAVDLQTFRETYENAHRIMRLESLEYDILIQRQETHRLTEFIYDMGFTTRILGTFSDKLRRMLLVLDPDDVWRVAWSSADIFAEMGGGGRLRMETFVPQRANIYDRDGTILADMNGVIAVINVIPGQIPDREACIRTLGGVLARTEDQVREQLANYNSEQLAEIGSVEPQTFRSWEEALDRDCAARYDHRATRRYIFGELAPHIIGNVGYPDDWEIPAIEAAGFRRDTILGKSGIERSWDETLRGIPGGQLSIVTPDGQRLRLLAEIGSQPAQSVYLTIDDGLQRFTLRAITEAYANNLEGWGRDSRGAAAIILDPNTGAILAMVSYPTYNANAFLTFPPMGQAEGQTIVRAVQDDPREPQVNRVTQGEYPTGSTMKIISAAAALDSGAWGMTERYNSTGVWNRDIPRYDWLRGGHGSVTLAGALTVSCNTCFYEVGYRLNEIDPWLYYNYARRLGLHRPSGLRDLPEAIGLIGNPDNKQSYEPTGVAWNFSDAVSIAIGQGGVQVTPLQQARVLMAIANGGTLYRPQLVDRVGLLDHFTYQMEPDPMEQNVLQPHVIEFIREGLCAVTTSPVGTATHIFRDSPLLEIGVCGKTGTATAGRGNVLPHAGFNAYAPADNPEIVIVVVVENSGDGSAVAAPIARRIMEYYFYGIE